MNTSLVSICMPVFNGQRFLAQAIESLLNQDYPNTELIILDNQSTDATPDICRRFAASDSRVRHLVDTERVDVMEGHKRAAKYARGDYFLVACDDDVYEPNYISTLMTLMRADGRVGLTYSGFDWIDEAGVRGTPAMPAHFLRHPSRSCADNFRFYLWHRCPVPLAFGLLTRDAHLDALGSFYRVDLRGWNHDNLYMLRLLSRVRVDSTPEVLFHYRQRDRSNTLPPDEPNHPLLQFVYWTGHQVRVCRAIGKIIAASTFSWWEKRALDAHNLLVLACFLVLRGYWAGKLLWLGVRRPTT